MTAHTSYILLQLHYKRKVLKHRVEEPTPHIFRDPYDIRPPSSNYDLLTQCNRVLLNDSYLTQLLQHCRRPMLVHQFEAMRLPILEQKLEEGFDGDANWPHREPAIRKSTFCPRIRDSIDAAQRV